MGRRWAEWHVVTRPAGARACPSGDAASVRVARSLTASTSAAHHVEALQRRRRRWRPPALPKAAAVARRERPGPRSRVHRVFRVASVRRAPGGAAPVGQQNIPPQGGRCTGALLRMARRVRSWGALVPAAPNCAGGIPDPGGSSVDVLRALGGPRYGRSMRSPRNSARSTLGQRHGFAAGAITVADGAVPRRGGGRRHLLEAVAS